MKSILLLSASLLLLSSCTKNETSPSPTTRVYRMGFANSAPRFDNTDTVILSLNLWTQRADAAIISTEVPWDSLYSGESAQHYVAHNYTSLAAFYRSKNLKLWVYIDPQNGLNRTSDSYPLVAKGKSIAQTDVQKVYRRFVVVMDSMLKPDHLGLALETNLIRAAATSSIYTGVKEAANAAAADVRGIDATVKLSVSVQADVAWGNLVGSGNYVGISQDLIDFPFLQEVGISSYPYFNVSKPEDLPIDYYSKLVDGKSLPVFISEGGWASETFTGPNGTIASSPVLQQDYITRQSQLLDHAQAIAVFQLTFTDINISLVPGYVDPSIKYFTSLGMVGIHLQAKPSLTTWDNLYKRKFVGN